MEKITRNKHSDEEIDAIEEREALLSVMRELRSGIQTIVDRLSLTEGGSRERSLAVTKLQARR